MEEEAIERLKFIIFNEASALRFSFKLSGMTLYIYYTFVVSSVEENWMANDFSKTDYKTFLYRSRLYSSLFPDVYRLEVVSFLAYIV